MESRTDQKSEDPGVPEALPRTLVATRNRFAPEDMDHLWIFPPLRRGRRERGLVAVSLTMDGEERRRERLPIDHRRGAIGLGVAAGTDARFDDLSIEGT